MSSPSEVTENSEAGVVKTRLAGYDLLLHPALNKGTAFSEAERDTFALHGLLPPHVGALDEQLERRMKAFDLQTTSFGRYSFMRELQDTNETLFYALVTRNVEKFLPIVYTPTVGEGCQRFSEIWRKPRGLFLSYPNKHRIDQILADPRYDKVRCIVVSDGERILGLGDQGAGGMGIPIGKMALYTALAGIPPQHCLPVLLDVGTDNEDRLRDPIYIGWRSKRVRGQEYDDFVEAFVSAVKRRWPHILLQWEDFAGTNAARLLARYRDQLCTFNDDIQGTAAVTTATILGAVTATGVPLKEQNIGILGFGTAGIGIANLLLAALKEEGLSDAEAHRHFYAVDRYGLLVEGGKDIRPDQAPYVRKKSDLKGWILSNSDEISLADVARNAKLTVLIGVSGQAGVFTEEIVREMTRHADRPVIFPLSNPTSRSEGIPADLLKWSDGKALIGTGSPFPAAEINGKTVHFAQTNNSYIFPGLALGILTSKAKRVSDAMIMASAKALAAQSPTHRDKNADLLPPLADSRKVSLLVAEAVGKQAIAEGLSGFSDEKAFEKELHSYVWEPFYRTYERLDD
ncbi:malate dehydrogenase (oxaloacetate-decarboxylating) [Silvibacterium bohemicum]|uniref:Malate dehydrogenase (Oxaloacetate-decarboxylating) n=1 Tax=Silvibacterium bohemicum TaxID=1577686 RepID=A0A841K819_9BACT|nr:NAD-dependent malic enzyme [Silvibacterium bohemicum]MBB6146718.1 malate dehydrogenase (oxaloacetate-decarboxylating) [Silvibacterium bohemicum]